MHRYSFPEDKGLDFLDSLCAGNVAKVRFGRMLHTFIADEAGNLVADCYVANNDEQFFLLAESIMDDAAFKAMLFSRGAADAGMVDLSESHALLSIDGYKAWAVVKGLFGADVLGLPYLSVERYEFGGTAAVLVPGRQDLRVRLLPSGPCGKRGRAVRCVPVACRWKTRAGCAGSTFTTICGSKAGSSIFSPKAQQCATRFRSDCSG